MAQTIRRGGKTARKSAAKAQTKTRVDKVRRHTGGALEAFRAMIPLSDETLHRGLVLLVVGLAGALAWGVAQAAGLPDLARLRIDQAATDAGFKVERVEVRGVAHMNELKIYDRVLAARDQAMTALDLDQVRAGLLDLDWVKDARVSRRLPDTLVIDVVERTPKAVLRQDENLVLIDETGHHLDPVKPSRAKGMMVLGGAGAELHMADLEALLAAAPAMRPQVAEADWIGNRRWNVVFHTGQVLALPEGADEAAASLVSFARMDGVDRLLGGKVAYFDMRAADKMYMRIPGHADELAKAARDEAEAKRKAKAAAAH